VEPTDIVGEQTESKPDLPRLSAAEDSELRQLTWFAQVGSLSEKSQCRLSELRARDRRETVRDPRPDPGSGDVPPVVKRLSVDPVETTSCPRCGFNLTGSGSSICPYCAFHLTP
jgi:hypothetical protein